MSTERAAILKWRSGHAAAERRQRDLLATEGPRPAQAVAEALSALAALEAMGAWPGPRDPASERAVEVVRRRWAKVQRRARATRIAQLVALAEEPALAEGLDRLLLAAAAQAAPATPASPRAVRARVAGRPKRRHPK